MAYRGRFDCRFFVNNFKIKYHNQKKTHYNMNVLFTSDSQNNDTIMPSLKLPAKTNPNSRSSD